MVDFRQLPQIWHYFVFERALGKGPAFSLHAWPCSLWRISIASNSYVNGFMVRWFDNLKNPWINNVLWPPKRTQCTKMWKSATLLMRRKIILITKKGMALLHISRRQSIYISAMICNNLMMIVIFHISRA